MSEAANEKANGYGSGTSDDGSQSAAPEVFERPTGLKGAYYNPYGQVYFRYQANVSVIFITLVAHQKQKLGRYVGLRVFHVPWSVQRFERPRWRWPSRRHHQRKRQRRTLCHICGPRLLRWVRLIRLNWSFED